MRQSESGGIARPRRAINTNYFTLYARFSSTKKQELRLAFGARTGTAAVRNRAKRLARETFRLNRQQLPVGVDILITAKKGIGALRRRDMRDQICGLFERARRLSPSSPSDSVKSDDTDIHR
ncbi:MAG: ribonuclease P protein component [candidate division NC10 bacterium]|nr:ribonuclease P protein component [candidate division NC10 bacterium]